MQKKKVLKITPVLITLNILVLFVIAGFYTARLIKYYIKENGEDEDSAVLLVDEIIKKRSYLDETKGLVFNEKEKTYVYKGKVEDNYISYSGMTFRVVGINEDGHIKAVSEDNVTLLYPGFDKGYKDSYAIKWLNSNRGNGSGVYKKALLDTNNILESSTYCTDQIDDVTKITCDNKTKEFEITMLSLYDYKESGGKDGYLNNGTSFNLGTLNKDKLNYYVTEEGETAIHQKYSTPITIKPVITFNKDVELIRGNGKKDNPYIVEEHEVKRLIDANIGSIIKIGDKTYKVVETQKDKVKVVTTDILRDKDKPIVAIFSEDDNKFSTDNVIGKFLNRTYYNTLSIKSSIVESEFNIGKLSDDELDYTLLTKESVKAKVGLLTMGDMFVNEGSNVLTILRTQGEDNLINVINESGVFYADVISSSYNVKPAFCLKHDLTITKGNGTIQNPYEIGVANDKKESK